MNRWRIAGLVLLAALLAWFAVRSLMPEAPPPPPPEPVRETFHPAKPLHLEVRTAADPEALPAELRWLDRELRHLLARGKMNVAPIGGVDADAGSAAAPYTLRVTLSDDHTRAQVELVAPDRIVDKRADVALSDESQLATLQTFAQHLPSFLSAPGGTADWTAAPGTTDAAAYGEFLRAGDALLGPDGTGFTAPAPSGGEAAQRLEQLERLARRQRQFARARALLSLAYLSVGGEDEASLTKLAETAAERALALDAALADAQAALGIVRLRRMEWTAAQEHFDAALELDANSIPALEGLGCLLMDVGHVRAALPVALRSVALQPGNRGARECATYARIATGAETASLETESADTARIHAVMSLLAGDRAGAEALLRSGAAIDDGLARIIIEASGSKDRIPEALQAVTTSADDEAIDAETEILFGVALRRPDFVFNRMLRLAKQDEAVPLRVLWLPQTEFLRKHRRFREVVSTATLTTYWQDHGRPDVCESEPKVPGCAVKRN
jgi:tetratricopeptide (TPR) repeat protein